MFSPRKLASLTNSSYVAWGRKPVATQQVKTSEEDNAMSEEELLGEDDLTGEGNE